MSRKDLCNDLRSDVAWIVRFGVPAGARPDGMKPDCTVDAGSWLPFRTNPSMAILLSNAP